MRLDVAQLFVMLMLISIPVIVLYFVVRLAVRHGIRDSRKNGD